MVGYTVVSIDAHINGATDFFDDMGTLAGTVISEIHHIDSNVSVATMSTETVLGETDQEILDLKVSIRTVQETTDILDVLFVVSLKVI